MSVGEDIMFRMFRAIIRGAVAIVLLSLPAGPTAAPAPTPWEPMRYFIGSWTGTGTGEPGESTVKREYRWTLKDRFIEAVNVSTYAPQPKNPQGEVHEDRGMFSWDKRRRRFVLRQFHVEGFVNQYVADSLATGVDSLVFRSEAIENIPPGYRARETYRILGPDEFVERFELAKPGAEFAVYSETRFRRSR